MELALAGIPGAADGSMSVSEMLRWGNYAAKHGLPFRMLQLQLALIAWRVVTAFGGEGYTIDDFLPEMKEPEVMTEDDESVYVERLFG